MPYQNGWFLEIWKPRIVVSSGIEYLAMLVIYSTSSLILPAYFNLLTLFNQTYKHRALHFLLNDDDEARAAWMITYISWD